MISGSSEFTPGQNLEQGEEQDKRFFKKVYTREVSWDPTPSEGVRIK